MDTMELGAIGELVGGVAVPVTLAYLAVQVGQSNRLGKAETSRAAARDYIHTMRWMDAALFHRGTRDFEALSKDEPRGRGGRRETRRWLSFPSVALAMGWGLALMLAGCREASSPQADTSTERGAALFAEHCIDCHGTDARGSGPIAAGLSAAPADLTQIAQRRGGEFLAADVRRMVDGRSDFVGHRDVEMPLWGDFFANEPDSKIEALVNFLESIQVAGEAEAQAAMEGTGRTLFVRYCASCHGEEGRGDGPVAASLATPPADLTTLAQRAAEGFNPSAVMATIDGRRDIAAHGQREMPVWGVVFMNEQRAAGERQAGHLSLLLTKILTDYVVSLQGE